MFDSHIAFHAGTRPDAPAIITPAGTLSFARLEAEVARAATILAGAAGRGPVAVEMDDAVERWIAVLALARLRVASAPPGEGETALRRIAPLPVARGPADAPSDTGRILVTSATMGTQRRVALTWAMIEAGIRNAPLAYGMPEGPVQAATGMQTIMGFIMPLAAWGVGNPVLLGCGPPTPELLERYSPRMICFVPAMLRDLVTAMTRPHDAPLKLMVGGGGVPPALAERTLAMLGPDLVGVYGATETGAAAVSLMETLRTRPGTAGWPVPDTELEIVDGEGRALPRGQTGEIRLRGPRVATAYDRDPEASAARFRDGWFHSGDLGRIAPDGLLTVEGRADELMNIAGIKTLPGWIEDAALACEGVTDAGVVTLRGPDGVDVCCVCVVRDPRFTEQALVAALAEPVRRLGRIDWRAVPAIPRNAMGKVDRAALRELVEA